MASSDKLFEILIQKGGSDLHIAQGRPPIIRLHGLLTPISDEILTKEIITKYLQEICPPEKWEEFLKIGDIDFAYGFKGQARLRSNYYRHINGIGGIFRIIPIELKSFDDLGLPPVLRKFTTLRSGLVVITGPTGAGKSTTLSAIINEINENYEKHILTIEEPIEFVHSNKKSIICQREVGVDVLSFADALRTASRQDIDVILVGEMRDYETISLAVSAAETGLLVFATLHTNSAAKTIDRIIGSFPADHRGLICAQLASSLKGVAAQLLLRKADGTGRIAAIEVLLESPALGPYIREGKVSNVRRLIEAGKSVGMQSMDDAIEDLLHTKVISEREAYLKAIDKIRFSKDKEVAL